MTSPDPADPLADLRADQGPALPGAATLPTVLTEGEGPVEVRPMVSQEVWDAMVTEMVVAWHADPTSQGFLHCGGQCGCHYIARHALRVTVPVTLELVEDLAGE